MMDNIDLEDFVEFYQDNYSKYLHRRCGKQESWKLRAFCYCANHIFGIPLLQIAKAINKDHSTLIHHLKKLNKEDIGNAYTMSRKYYEWDMKNDAPILTKKWFRQKFKFPFRIIAFAKNADIEIWVNGYSYDAAREIIRKCQQMIPVYIKITIYKSEDTINQQLFAYGDNE